MWRGTCARAAAICRWRGWRAAGLKPEDLLQPANEPRLRPLYHAYLDRAEAHLLAGWAYTNALPRRHVRVRLACAWPILIGRETLVRLRAGQRARPGSSESKSTGARLGSSCCVQSCSIPGRGHGKTWSRPGKLLRRQPFCRKKAPMQISKSFLVACAAAYCVALLPLRAADADTERKLREALEQKLNELQTQPPSATPQTAVAAPQPKQAVAPAAAPTPVAVPAAQPLRHPRSSRCRPPTRRPSPKRARRCARRWPNWIGQPPSRPRPRPSWHPRR